VSGLVTALPLAHDPPLELIFEFNDDGPIREAFEEAARALAWKQCNPCIRASRDPVLVPVEADLYWPLTGVRHPAYRLTLRIAALNAVRCGCDVSGQSHVTGSSAATAFGMIRQGLTEHDLAPIGERAALAVALDLTADQFPADAL
jgi:hypothetical protein